MLEFNELCPSLIKRFIEAGELPNFEKLHNSSIVKVTDAEASGEDLNPWVQWADLHTGLNFKQHGLHKLNEAHKLQGKFTWDVLAEKMGIKSWICGSMNAGYSKEFNGRFLPDPWTVNIAPFPPKQMDKYYNFISQSVQGHSSSGETVSSKAFIKEFLKQGASISTILKLLNQLVKEKLLGKGNWERAMLLDWMQLDLFSHYYKKENPGFATFFSNCVAHYQHHYWKDYEPELFNDPNYTPNKEKSKAILKAYKNTDAILGKIMRMVDNDTAVLFVTALSQQPYIENERYYYHISSEKDFRLQFNIPESVLYKPVMAHQFHLETETEEQAKSLAASLESYDMDSDEYFHVGTNQLFLVFQNGNILDVQCRLTKNAKQNSMFINNRTGERHSLYDHFYQMSETKAGMHNPIGLYWFKNPQKQPCVSKEVCAPAQVHHDIINYFGITN